tara:strand:- start:133 stop:1338 length:1206 start_codon:yes stop_codon:yes gene_type:complete
MWCALLIPPLSPTALFVRPLITDTRNPFLAEMTETAKQLCRPGYGILATDESIPTAGKRLETIGVDNTVATRTAFRELLYTTPGLEEYISGTIMFDETLYQRTAGGVRFVQLLKEKNILTGLKVDTGLQPLSAHSPKETATQGLDNLAARCDTYYAEGARFAKWRAVINVGRGPQGKSMPSEHALQENAHGLARFAAICQQHGLMPIVEPEVALGEGDYSISAAAAEQERFMAEVISALRQHGVYLEAMLLKPNMALPGLDALIPTKEEVAYYTARMLKRTVPPAVPGIHFLSGGMGAEEATLNLQALALEYPDAPWALSFSYGRALQDGVLKAWGGDADNVAAAQQLLLDLARVNSEAVRGVWDEHHPCAPIKGESGRLDGLAKYSYSEERKESGNIFNW